ncbi:hypothetical protein BCR39DRAFT_52533 [Naematelia encephala]|uniref:Kinesin motor domain-containing protein n=1 Tax=Naematelia encephala TaxID=71784 RepID=A0A1Y2AGH2_9TREE|nr:hypothetical protein BCR39DRAFT_52533 [Naematelia encephala]
MCPLFVKEWMFCGPSVVLTPYLFKNRLDNGSKTLDPLSLPCASCPKLVLGPFQRFLSSHTFASTLPFHLSYLRNFIGRAVMSLGELGKSEQLAVPPSLVERGYIYEIRTPLDCRKAWPEGQTVDNHGRSSFITYRIRTDPSSSGADGAILRGTAEELYTNIKSGMGPQTLLAHGLSDSGKSYSFTRLMESLLEHLQTHSSFDLSSVPGHVKSYSELMDVFGSAQMPSNAHS